MIKVLRAIGAYLTDWKNLAVHAAFGVLLLCIALFLPVAWYVRAAILCCVVALNTLRMRWDRKRKAAKAQA